MNPLIAGLTRVGLSSWGSRVLEVRGRKSGEPRRVPVNPLTLDSGRYLAAPWGHTQWVCNLRASGEGDLLLGSRRERFSTRELDEAEKGPVLRAYLRGWKREEGQFFDGVAPDSPGEGFARITPNHPVFRISTRARVPQPRSQAAVAERLVAERR